MEYFELERQNVGFICSLKIHLSLQLPSAM